MSALEPRVLARGPWTPDRIAVRWLDETYEADADGTAAADRAIAALAERGSPSHDGLAARLAAWRSRDDMLELDLQPMRWSLRLGPYAAQALSVLCVVRDAEGRWLAGRRAGWVASWAGRWALGAGGSVELGEDPVVTLRRELAEEWSVEPERLSAEALVILPSGMAMLIGLARLAPGASVAADAEHDAHAWWPADVHEWPPEADEVLRRTALLLTA